MHPFTAKQRQIYEAVKGAPDGPFDIERPAMFSPAAAAQDEQNGKGGHGQWAAMFLPTEFTDWVEESRAHVESCYVGDWSALSQLVIRGPEALPFLQWLGMANLASFEIGRLKHHVQLDDQGRVASEGVLGRTGEEDFLFTAGSTEWLVWQLERSTFDADVADVTPERFIIGVQGPRSLDVLERVAGQSLRDIAFSRSCAVALDGIPVRVLRTGISGELGYELHGPAEHANAVWAAIRDHGADFGIRQLGLRAQGVQHIEAGIATNGRDYLAASIGTPGAPKLFRRRSLGGSFVASSVEDYFRTPGELNWTPRSGRLPGHDFLGRDALAADAAEGGPHRRLVGLVWEPQDVVGVFAALFGDGEVPDQMDLPRRSGGTAFDQVLVAGEPRGVSSGRTVSANLRAMISLCVLDRAVAEADTAVTVLWGRPGTDQREIRARVVELPFKLDRRRGDAPSA